MALFLIPDFTHSGNQCMMTRFIHVLFKNRTEFKWLPAVNWPASGIFYIESSASETEILFRDKSHPHKDRLLVKMFSVQ